MFHATAFLGILDSSNHAAAPAVPWWVSTRNFTASFVVHYGSPKRGGGGRSGRVPASIFSSIFINISYDSLLFRPDFPLPDCPAQPSSPSDQQQQHQSGWYEIDCLPTWGRKLKASFSAAPTENTVHRKMSVCVRVHVCASVWVEVFEMGRIAALFANNCTVWVGGKSQFSGGLGDGTTILGIGSSLADCTFWIAW